MVRQDKFSGTFYPKNKEELKKQIYQYIKEAVIPKKLENGLSYVSPHAGYIYSGKTAAYTYKALSLNKNLKSIDTIIIVGPNHTGYGENIAVSFEDWKTPLGILKNNKILSEEISKFNIKQDEIAHVNEHSIEVQLPFLNIIAPDKKYCFVCMLDQSLDAAVNLSDAIFNAIKKTNTNAIVIASSDFNHYESAEIANKKDTELINALIRLDYKKFNKLIIKLDDTACGFGAITTAVLFAKKQGATNCNLLSYSNSGKETDDYSSVVAYSSLVFY